MVDNKTAYRFAVNSQGYNGSFNEFVALPPEEKAEYEVGAGSINSEAYHTGYEAAKQGDKISDNPYLEELCGHGEWAKGFKDFLEEFN